MLFSEGSLKVPPTFTT